MKRLLFLCTGNYYRSRFAEIFFNWHAQRSGLPWQAESRGLALFPGNEGPVSQHTLATLAARGMASAACERFPQQASDDDFAAAHHIVAVKTDEHRPMIEANFPQWLELIEFWQVHDLDCALPEEALPQLEQQVLELLHRLAVSEQMIDPSPV